MELRVLQYFLAIAREETILGAAERLHMTQPTLSRQMKELEEELGKQLFIRGNRKITLTDDGMLLRQRAEEIVTLVEKTESDIMLSDASLSGDIYIGAGETDGMRLIAKVMHKCCEVYPNIKFHIFSGNSQDVADKRKGRNTPFRPHGGLPYPIGRSVVVPFLPPGRPKLPSSSVSAE